MVAKDRRVFVSYAHANQQLVLDNIVAPLRAAQIDVFIDGDLLPGDNFPPRFLQEIQTRDAVVFALSPESCKSEYCAKELAHARRVKTPIIPVMVVSTPLPQIPDWLRNNINFENVDTPQRGPRLVAAIQRLPRLTQVRRRWLQTRKFVAILSIMLLALLAWYVVTARALPHVLSFHPAGSGNLPDVWHVAPDGSGGVWFVVDGLNQNNLPDHSDLFHVTDQQVDAWLETRQPPNVTPVNTLAANSAFIRDLMVDCRGMVWVLYSAPTSASDPNELEGLARINVDGQFEWVLPGEQGLSGDSQLLNSRCAQGQGNPIEVYVANVSQPLVIRTIEVSADSNRSYTLLPQDADPLNTALVENRPLSCSSSVNFRAWLIDGVQDVLWIADTYNGVFEVDLQHHQVKACYTTLANVSNHPIPAVLALNGSDLFVGTVAGGIYTKDGQQPFSNSDPATALAAGGRFIWSGCYNAGCAQPLVIFNQAFFNERQVVTDIPSNAQIHELKWDATRQMVWAASTVGLFVLVP